MSLPLNIFLKEITELYKIEEFNNLKKYNSFFEKIGVNFNSFCVSDDDENFEDFIYRVNESLKVRDHKFDYLSKLQKQEELYDLLQDYEVDKISLSLYKRLEKNEGINELLNHFRFYEKVKYTRSNIVSGRLSVVKGPRFMQLPKKYRNIVKSVYSEGEILMVDFVSLEPRVAKYIGGGECEKDIYQEICDQMSFIVDRTVMKRAVISILYGASEELQIGELTQDKVQEIRNKVFEYFNIDKLLANAIKQDEWGYRRSYWGRPIHWGEDVRMNQVLNGYIQSTAVDVALDGFLYLTKQFNEYMRPLFFIHDAMFVDVKKEYKNEFVKIIQEGYNCKELGFFPLNIELVSERRI